MNVSSWVPRTGGDFNMNGGSLNIKSNKYFIIAEGASATGAYNQTAGTVNFSPVAGNTAGNDVYITNSSATAVGSMNVSGGSFTVNGSNLKIKVAAIGTGSLSVGGGAGTATVTTPRIEMSTAATSISTVDLLANGTLEVANPINELTAARLLDPQFRRWHPQGHRREHGLHQFGQHLRQSRRRHIQYQRQRHHHRQRSPAIRSDHRSLREDRRWHVDPEQHEHLHRPHHRLGRHSHLGQRRIGKHQQRHHREWQRGQVPANEFRGGFPHRGAHAGLRGWHDNRSMP